MKQRVIFIVHAHDTELIVKPNPYIGEKYEKR